MTDEKSSEENSERVNFLFPYLTGLLTAMLIFGMFSLFIGYKAGFSNVYLKLKSYFIPTQAHVRFLKIPEDVLEELTELEAPIGNANNPTKLPKHNTLLVQPDDELGFRLRPDKQIQAHLLRTTKANNLDPPVLYLKRGDEPKYSERLKKYIEEETRIQFSYGTDSNGFRRTLPRVEADEQILVIGDSVAFGVGVNDEDTSSSQLQKMLGQQYQVVNSGVGNYTGHQAFLMAQKLSAKNNYVGLIYIACQNDFMNVDDWIAKAEGVISELTTISDRFNNNVIVVLETYMEYNLHDFFLDTGWQNDQIENTELLREKFPKLVTDAGFVYHDWSESVSEFMLESGSIFSRFALYYDHDHLSPLGNRLMAIRLYSMMDKNWPLEFEPLVAEP